MTGPVRRHTIVGVAPPSAGSVTPGSYRIKRGQIRDEIVRLRDPRTRFDSIDSATRCAIYEARAIVTSRRPRHMSDERTEPSAVKVMTHAGGVHDLPSPSFAAAQVAVGGYVEVVRVPQCGVLLVNEDGRALALPYNRLASLLCGQVILGDVVYVSPDRIEQMLGAP